MQNFNKSYSPFYNNIHRRNFIPPNYSSFPFSPNTLKSSKSNFLTNNQESEKKSDYKNNNIQFSNDPSILAKIQFTLLITLWLNYAYFAVNRA